MLAPPFTRENAAEMARRATRSREENRARLKRGEMKLPASRPDLAQCRAVRQVNKILAWMETEIDRDKYAQLCAMLDKVWNMAYPKAGVMRPRAGNQRRSAPSVTETPQEVPQTQAVNPPPNTPPA